MKTQTKISIERAHTAAGRGDLVRARAILRNAAIQEPECEEIFMLFAEWAQKREHAIQCYEKVLKINPNNFVALEALHLLEEAAAPNHASPATHPAENPLPNKKSPPRSRPAGSSRISFGIRTAISSAFLVIIAVGTTLATQSGQVNSPITELSVEPTKAPTVVSEAQEPVVALPELSLTKVGRLVIREMIPDEYLDPWAQITIDSFDKYAVNNEEKTGHYYEASVRIFVEFIHSHDVKFRMQVLNHSTNLITPVLIEEQVHSNRDLELDPNAIQEFSFGFYQASPAEDSVSGIEILSVELLRIDGLRDEEWVAPQPEENHLSDVWVITNPHDVHMSLNWEYRKYDAAGNLVQVEVYPPCPQNPNDLSTIHLQAAYIPPGESIIVSKDMSESEDDGDYTTEFEITSSPRCISSNSIIVSPDERIVLESAKLEGNLITLVIYNGSAADAMAQLYVNVYDDHGEPIHGLVLILDSSNLLLQPGQRSQLSVYMSELLWEDPPPTDYEFVLTGLRIER